MTSVFVIIILLADSLSFLISIFSLNSTPVLELFSLLKADSNILKMLQTFSIPPKKKIYNKKLKNAKKKNYKNSYSTAKILQLLCILNPHLATR